MYRRVPLHSAQIENGGCFYGDSTCQVRLIFMWCMFNDILPTNFNLSRRGINCSRVCVRCNDGDKSILHALIRRDFAYEVGTQSFCWKIISEYRGPCADDEFLLFLYKSLSKIDFEVIGVVWCGSFGRREITGFMVTWAVWLKGC